MWEHSKEPRTSGKWFPFCKQLEIQIGSSTTNWLTRQRTHALSITIDISIAPPSHLEGNIDPFLTGGRQCVPNTTYCLITNRRT